MLRNRTALIAIALAAFVALRLLPFPSLSVSIGDRFGSGSPSVPDQAGAQATSASRSTQPAIIDPSQLQGQRQPFLVVRASTLTKGAPLTIGGQSFQPFQELSISLVPKDGKPMELGTATTDKDGMLQDTTFALPDGVGPGSYTVRAIPARGGSAVEASVLVQSSQTWARLTSTAAKPNEAVGYEGGGFMPGEKVAVLLDSLGSSPVTTAVASAEGTVSGALRVPLAQEGNHQILFYGEQSKTPTMVDLFVLGFSPWVVLDDYSPTPEHPVGFAGSDFTPGEKVYVFLNQVDSGPVAVVQAGPDGSFKAPSALSLGPDVKGKQTLIFVGSESQTTTKAQFTVQPYPASLELTIYAGPPGSQVAFTGRGFARGEEVDAYIGEPATGKAVSTFKADDSGTFTGAGSFRVPRDTKAGDLTLSVVGRVSDARASVTFTVLEISPWIQAKQGQGGLAVVAGHGFAAGEVVDLLAGDSQDKPLATSGADKDGNVQFAPLSLPSGGNGPISIRLKGRDSGGEAKTDYYPGPSSEGAATPSDGTHGTLEFRPSGTPGPTPAATTPAAAPTAGPAASPDAAAAMPSPTLEVILAGTPTPSRSQPGR